MHGYKAGFRGRGRRRSSLETPGLHQSPPLEVQGAFAEQQQRQDQFGFEPTGPPPGWMHNAVPYSGQHESEQQFQDQFVQRRPSQGGPHQEHEQPQPDHFVQLQSQGLERDYEHQQPLYQEQAHQQQSRQATPFQDTFYAQQHQQQQQLHHIGAHQQQEQPYQQQQQSHPPELYQGNKQPPYQPFLQQQQQPPQQPPAYHQPMQQEHIQQPPAQHFEPAFQAPRQLPFQSQPYQQSQQPDLPQQVQFQQQRPQQHAFHPQPAPLSRQVHVLQQHLQQTDAQHQHDQPPQQVLFHPQQPQQVQLHQPPGPLLQQPPFHQQPLQQMGVQLAPGQQLLQDPFLQHQAARLTTQENVPTPPPLFVPYREHVPTPPLPRMPLPPPLHLRPHAPAQHGAPPPTLHHAPQQQRASTAAPPAMPHMQWQQQQQQHALPPQATPPQARRARESKLDSLSRRPDFWRHSPPGGDDLLSSNYAGAALRPREADWYKAAGILPLATLPPERGGCAAVLLGVEMRKGAQCIGHMGGKREDHDGRPAETAWRETWEESGKVLTPEAHQAFMAATDSGAARVLWVRDCKQVLYAYRVPVEWGDALVAAFNGAAVSGGSGGGGGGSAAGGVSSGAGVTRAGATADRSNTTLLELRWVPVRELEAAASSGRVAGFMPAPLLRAMLRDRAFIAELQAAPAEAADAAQAVAAGARPHWGAPAEAVAPESRGMAELAAQAAQEPAAAGGFADWQHRGGAEAAAQQQETAPAGEHQAAAPAAENPEDVSMAEDESTSTTDDEEDVSMAEEQEEAVSAAQHQEAVPAAQRHGDVPVAERAGAAQARAQPGAGEEPAPQQQAARQVETLVWSDEDEDNFDTGFDDLIAVLRAAP